jgi:hypothetical protein
MSDTPFGNPFLRRLSCPTHSENGWFACQGDGKRHGHVFVASDVPDQSANKWEGRCGTVAQSAETIVSPNGEYEQPLMLCRKLPQLHRCGLG